MEERKVVCIVNCTAGSDAARNALEKLTTVFQQHDSGARILCAASGSELASLANQALKEGASVVVAAGGDGTINGVASTLIGKEIQFGIIPMGTLNHFAKDLNIPLEVEDAVANVYSGIGVPVDVGKVNGRFFLNNSSVGLYPTIVRHREAGQKKGRAKWLAFAVATIYGLWRYARLTVTLQPEGSAQVEEQTPFVFVGNNKYEVSGFHIGERPGPLNAGRLWIYMAPRASRLVLFRLALRALWGCHDPNELNVLEVKEITIRMRKRRPHVSTDGEVTRLETPLNYRILPKALQVIVPKDADDHLKR